MKSYRKELWFNVPGRRAFINITPQVQECLRESGIQEGLCLVNTMRVISRILIRGDEFDVHHVHHDNNASLRRWPLRADAPASP